MTSTAASSNAARQVPLGRLAVYGVVLLIGLALAFAPFIFPDVRAQEVAARICIFIVLVASYDLLIGYTGIVSFAHTMFFGLGAYGTAIALKGIGPTWGAVALGGSAGIAAAFVLALLIDQVGWPGRAEPPRRHPPHHPPGVAGGRGEELMFVALGRSPRIGGPDAAPGGPEPAGRLFLHAP